MSRKLQGRYLSNDNKNDQDLLISEKYTSKTSTNLDKIKEEMKENGGSQATYHADSKDPRKQNDSNNEEQKMILKCEEKFKNDNIFAHYDEGNIQSNEMNSKLLAKDIFYKLQPGDKEVINIKHLDYFNPNQIIRLQNLLETKYLIKNIKIVNNGSEYLKIII